MNISSISFGKKYPVIKCKVQDKETKKFVPVTVYEYDCSEESDLKDFKEKSKNSNWIYKREFTRDMKMKLNSLGRENYYTTNRFYVMENKGEIIGMCETHDDKDGSWIEYLESPQRSKYKYIGQTLIAITGHFALKNKQPKLFINEPSVGALPFYKKTCGFRINEYCHPEMNKLQMRTFLYRTQLKTRSKIKGLENE